MYRPSELESNDLALIALDLSARLSIGHALYPIKPAKPTDATGILSVETPNLEGERLSVSDDPTYD